MSLKGYKQSPEVIRNRVEKLRKNGTYIFSEEKKQKLRLAHFGKKLSEEHKEKLRKATKKYWQSERSKNRIFKKGKNHPNWKGDKVSIHQLHYRIRKQLGKPKRCSKCGTDKAKRIELANISGKYLSNLDDWRWLCSMCHAYEHKNWKKNWVIGKKGKDHPSWKGGLPKCSKCKKEISIRKNKYKRCWNCFAEIRKGNKHPKWKGGKPKCLICGKQLSAYSAKKCLKSHWQSMKK